MRFFSLLLFHIPFFINLSQVWQYKTSNDYAFSVKDKWGELKKYSIKFIVSDDSTIYECKTEGHQDNWTDAKFPDDFNLIKGRSSYGNGDYICICSGYLDQPVSI